MELIGPTMRILATNTRVAYSGMGSVLASRSGGYFLANILGVVLPNIVKKHSDGLLASAFILPAIGTNDSRNFNEENLLFFSSGVCHTICDFIDLLMCSVFHPGYGARFNRFRWNKSSLDNVGSECSSTIEYRSFRVWDRCCVG